MKDFLQKLQTTAWRTAGSRYNAYRRLKRREFFSTVSLAMFSAASAAIAFVQKMYVQSNPDADRYLTTASACIGILLLTISLIEWGSANGAKAENLFANAELLNEFQRKIDLVIAQLNTNYPLTWDDVHKLTEEYEIIKSRCNTNHIPLDDIIFLVQKRHASEFSKNNKPTIGWLKALMYQSYWYWISISYFVILWIMLAAALIFPFIKYN